jgi:hypothetical protein
MSHTITGTFTRGMSVTWTGACANEVIYRHRLRIREQPWGFKGSFQPHQPAISLEMPVPSQGHYVFTVFRLLTDFVCLYNYEFWLSLCKIVRSSVILLLPLFHQIRLDSGQKKMKLKAFWNLSPTKGYCKTTYTRLQGRLWY